MSEPTRNCFVCNAPINLCNGFILARDFVAFIEGKILAREFCGHCVELPDEIKAFAIAYTEPEPRP